MGYLVPVYERSGGEGEEGRAAAHAWCPPGDEAGADTSRSDHRQTRVRARGGAATLPDRPRSRPCLRRRRRRPAPRPRRLQQRPVRRLPAAGAARARRLRADDRTVSHRAGRSGRVRPSRLAAPNGSRRRRPRGSVRGGAGRTRRSPDPAARAGRPRLGRAGPGGPSDPRRERLGAVRAAAATFRARRRRGCRAGRPAGLSAVARRRRRAEHAGGAGERRRADRRRLPPHCDARARDAVPPRFLEPLSGGLTALRVARAPTGRGHYEGTLRCADGSLRRIVGMRSRSRSNEATSSTPLASALATRYASAKSSRSTS